jgi:hypothetical protein
MMMLSFSVERAAQRSGGWRAIIPSPQIKLTGHIAVSV